MCMGGRGPGVKLPIMNINARAFGWLRAKPIVRVAKNNRPNLFESRLSAQAPYNQTVWPVIFGITGPILRVPSSSPSVSLRFRDLHSQGIALPAQGVAQQFLNFLPLPQGQ